MVIYVSGVKSFHMVQYEGQSPMVLKSPLETVLCIDLYGKNDKVHQIAYKNQTLSPGLFAHT